MAVDPQRRPRKDGRKLRFCTLAIPRGKTRRGKAGQKLAIVRRKAQRLLIVKYCRQPAFKRDAGAAVGDTGICRVKAGRFLERAGCCGMVTERTFEQPLPLPQARARMPEHGARQQRERAPLLPHIESAVREIAEHLRIGGVGACELKRGLEAHSAAALPSAPIRAATASRSTWL